MFHSMRHLVHVAAIVFAAGTFLFDAKEAAAQFPIGGNPFGGNPFGGNPYGGSPFGGNPFGGNPYGGSPFGGNPFGGNPFGNPFGGGQQQQQQQRTMSRGRSYALWTGTGYNQEGSVRAQNNFGQGMGQGGFGAMGSVDQRLPAIFGYGIQFPAYGNPFFTQQQQMQGQFGGQYGGQFGGQFGSPFGGQYGSPFGFQQPFGQFPFR